VMSILARDWAGFVSFAAEAQGQSKREDKGTGLKRWSMCRRVAGVQAFTSA